MKLQQIVSTQFLLAAALLACAPQPDGGREGKPVPQRSQHPTLAIDDARLADADRDIGNWLLNGRTYADQRFSPLDQISENNVEQLGLRWSLETHTRRGLEATLIVVDGVLYASGSWSVVFAVDARTGREIWRWDPQVPRSYGQRACCDVVNRGVAVYQGRVYASILDGRIAALDAATGALVWETQTVDPNLPYTITGAPRVVEGKVIIGNSGAEYGVRGYVSAYDAESGEFVWRTFIVPGDPSLPFESKALEVAAETWTGEWWKLGGGGTAWDAIVYDPELRLLYVGTGNGSPWARKYRSPGGGDNLYLCSILALDPENGELVWHYQTTPGDNWDFTSTQPLMLADLRIDGETRKVIMQAPKNGFFYVIDRLTGKLISAENFVEVTWARGIDTETGRPIENPDLDYSSGRDGRKTVLPSPMGGHNWHPMSYNPDTGLVYIPAQEIAWDFELTETFEHRPGVFNLGVELATGDTFPRESVSGHLLAWDPVKQREVWRAQYDLPANGGTLSTAGNLVFHGTSDGRFVAYRASDGELLWEMPSGTSIIAAPVSYLVDGQQFISVLAGWGGDFGLFGGDAALAAGANNIGRLLTFALGGRASIPKFEAPARTPTPLAVTASDESVARGNTQYHRWCARCHGVGVVGGGVLADLRYATPETHSVFSEIVLGGALLSRGMPSFAKWIAPDELEAIRSYILSRANELARPDIESTPH
jgi:quinohemoprotein ethanol dehydrogenase